MLDRDRLHANRRRRPATQHQLTAARVEETFFKKLNTLLLPVAQKSTWANRPACAAMRSRAAWPNIANNPESCVSRAARRQWRRTSRPTRQHSWQLTRHASAVAWHCCRIPVLASGHRQRPIAIPWAPQHCATLHCQAAMSTVGDVLRGNGSSIFAFHLNPSITYLDLISNFTLPFSLRRNESKYFHYKL